MTHKMFYIFKQNGFVHALRGGCTAPVRSIYTYTAGLSTATTGDMSVQSGRATMGDTVMLGSPTTESRSRLTPPHLRARTRYAPVMHPRISRGSMPAASVRQQRQQQHVA